MLQQQEQKYFTVICNIHTVVPFTFISSSEEYAKKSSIYFCSRFFVSCHLSPEAKPSGQSKFSHGWWAFNAFWIFSSNSYTKPVQHCRRGHLISVANFDNYTKYESHMLLCKCWIIGLFTIEQKSRPFYVIVKRVLKLVTLLCWSFYGKKKLLYRRSEGGLLFNGKLLNYSRIAPKRVRSEFCCAGGKWSAAAYYRH